MFVVSGLLQLQLGVDESYTLLAAKTDGQSIVREVIIEANTIYGALRGLETFSQLCSFDYDTKSVQIYKAPWHIRDKPRFAYRGLLIDTSRHYLPIGVIKQIIESMSYAKLNVLHWHIIDEQSFPLEVPSYPKLWKGSYTKRERYSVEDAYEIVSFAKGRGINVMAEIDVPGHARSWGIGYPALWPSHTCREPLDLTKNFTFDVISGILTDMRKIFPFGLFHLGGDEVNTDCWNSAPHIKKWLLNQNMTAKDAYQYFVLRAQEIAISKNWTPVNWEETFNTFASRLNPRTIVHNWLGGGVCPKAIAQGFRCIFSNQGFWYLDHLDVPWDDVYNAEPLEGITDASEQKLVIGGEVCMWGETADTSDIQQTIWPRAAAAAERLWSRREAISSGNINSTALPRLHYFRCLLNGRGVHAAPVTNEYARQPPIGPGSCYVQ
uniref:beta-N-acetylhexosaminidase n=1 Tax=Rhizophora mucronata TaxID=61149 RepID=A0A2P2K9A3_RHIMU